MDDLEKPGPVFYVITREDLNRLAEAAIASANPPTHMACDWLSELKRRN